MDNFHKVVKPEVVKILNAFALDNLKQACLLRHASMWSYNNERTLSSLKYHTQTQFMLKYGNLYETFAAKHFPTFQDQQ